MFKRCQKILIFLLECKKKNFAFRFRLDFERLVELSDFKLHSNFVMLQAAH